MKATLIVLGVIVCLLFLLLVLPLTVDLSYEKELCYRIKYSGIVLFDSEKRVDIKKVRRKKKHKDKKQAKAEDDAAEKDGFFKKQYKQKGLLGAVRYFAELLGIVLKELWWVVKRFKIRRFKLNLTVATADAANTAMEYGGICCAVYPVLSFLETNSDFKTKTVNISADFDSSEPQFQISTYVTTRLIFWIVAALLVLFKFFKLQRKESEKYERK